MEQDYAQTFTRIAKIFIWPWLACLLLTFHYFGDMGFLVGGLGLWALTMFTVGKNMREMSFGTFCFFLVAPFPALGLQILLIRGFGLHVDKIISGNPLIDIPLGLLWVAIAMFPQLFVLWVMDRYKEF